jgi:hypothetical protein
MRPKGSSNIDEDTQGTTIIEVPQKREAGGGIRNTLEKAAPQPKEPFSGSVTPPIYAKTRAIPYKDARYAVVKRG